MAIQVRKYLISVENYHKMAGTGILPESGVELINGEIIEMSPIGSKHAAAVDRLNRILSRQFGDEVIIRVQNPIILNSFSEPEPDIAVVKYRADFYEKQHPHSADVLLAIEVSDTTINYDREIKLALYAQSGIPECWLVDLEKSEIQAFWQPLGDAYRFSQLARKGGSLKAQHFGLEIGVDQVLG